MQVLEHRTWHKHLPMIRLPSAHLASPYPPLITRCGFKRSARQEILVAENLKVDGCSAMDAFLFSFLFQLLLLFKPAVS
jgi:hypothetical protein